MCEKVIMKVSFTKTVKILLLILIALALAASAAGGVILSRYEQEEDARPDASQANDAEYGRQDDQDEDAESGESVQQEGEHAQDGRTDGEHEHDLAAFFASMTGSERITLICIAAFVACVLLLTWLLLAAWLYQEAESMRMNGTLWALLGLIGFVVTALVFVVVRSFWRRRPASDAQQPSEPSADGDSGRDAAKDKDEEK